MADWCRVLAYLVIDSGKLRAQLFFCVFLPSFTLQHSSVSENEVGMLSSEMLMRFDISV